MVRLLTVFFGCSTLLSACAEQELTRAGVAEFRLAYEAWDAGRFAAAGELLRRACANAPDDPTNHYWLGVAEFHRMLQLEHAPGRGSNAAAIRGAHEAALEALEVAVRLDDDDAESPALLGTLYGMRIGGNLFRAARLGPRVSTHQKQAIQLGADNPRVRYLLGMARFHTAKKARQWDEALATLEAAEKLFELEQQVEAGPLDPRWGRSSCLTFIGRCHELLGHPARAAESFRKALRLHPADHLAEAGLHRVGNTQ